VKNLTAPEFRARFADRQQRPVDAVPTHLPSLNGFCGDDGGGIGLAKGWFVTLGANPGFGKSAMALNLASHALHQGHQIGYISLEMTPAQLAARFYAIHTNVPIAGIERGRFDPDEWATVQARMNGVPPLYVPEQIGGAWEDVASFVRECYEAGCRWFVLDYLQLVQVGDEESINRAITTITTDLRNWCANNGATVVALSQFNRTTSADYSQSPRCQGLWGGMILEASSDVVLLLDHSRYKREDHIARTWLLVDKNRHGWCGELPVLWNYKTLRMSEGMPDELGDWPK
jgi:replicative DNA helicase